MKTDYDIIKKYYGERLAKLCRSLFPTIMENNGVLSDFLLETFYPNKHLYEDLIINRLDSFKCFVQYKLGIPNTVITTDKSVEELLSDAGYDFYEVHNYKEFK